MKCSQKNCENEAVWCYVWTSQQYACQSCFERMLGIANAIGFPTPENTARPIRVQDMLDEAERLHMLDEAERLLRSKDE